MSEASPQDATAVRFFGGRVVACCGDITAQAVDAIVNAANGTLLGGGGVDGAIHAAGGPAILAACRELRASEFPEGLPTGQAVATTAGRLPAKYVIHTVGPVWRGGAAGEDGLLAAAYARSLELAARLGCRTVALPAISTGVYGFPADRAAKIVAAALAEFFTREPVAVTEVRLVFFSAAALRIFLENSGLGDGD